MESFEFFRPKYSRSRASMASIFSNLSDLSSTDETPELTMVESPPALTQATTFYMSDDGNIHTYIHRYITVLYMYLQTVKYHVCDYVSVFLYVFYY